MREKRSSPARRLARAQSRLYIWQTRLADAQAMPEGDERREQAIAVAEAQLARQQHDVKRHQ